MLMIKNSYDKNIKRITNKILWDSFGSSKWWVVKQFLNKEIKFIDISKLLLKFLKIKNLLNSSILNLKTLEKF